MGRTAVFRNENYPIETDASSRLIKIYGYVSKNEIAVKQSDLQ